MSATVFVFRTDGTYGAVEISRSGGALRDLQRIVGGKIQIFPATCRMVYGMTCYVNEEGLLKNDLKRNFLAERVLVSLGFAIKMSVGIMGNAVLVNVDEGSSLAPDQLDFLIKLCGGVAIDKPGYPVREMQEMQEIGKLSEFLPGGSSSSGKKRGHLGEEKNARAVRPCSQSRSVLTECDQK